ncbi:hypothetical protein LUZ60_004965 [Juncus effusus]|nr:hypothetical protein LUZ60_004965 [Juncus effusus]
MEDISNLICQEDSTQLESESTEETKQEEKYHKTFLISPKCRGSCHVDYSSVISSDDGFKSLRSEAIHWILRTSIYFRMGFQTAYMAVSYLDRFSLKRSIDKEKPWSVRLLSIACLSLAAKMEEYRAPYLSEYLSEFSGENITRMELLVLSTLDWRMSCISPFDYLQDELTKDLVDSKINTLFFCDYSKKEHVYTCYNAMKQMSDQKGLKLPKRPYVHDSIGGIHQSSLSCNKRIKLHLSNIH